MDEEFDIVFKEERVKLCKIVANFTSRPRAIRARWGEIMKGFGKL